MLGAVMLSDDAANEVMDRLGPQDFYIPAHQAVFEAIVTLYNSNEPIDAITVSDLLRRKEEIERIGGVGFITRLMDAVPTASNVSYYADIVEEHSLRRSLLQAGAVIGDLATKTDQEIEDVVDEAERTVLGVAEKRVGEGLINLAGLINPELEKIEALEGRGTAITGLATGFRDLDKELAGLQPANLVIIAARPGMGKCLHGDTLIVDPKTGRRVPIRELVDSHLDGGQAHVLALDEDMELVQAAPVAARANGVQEVYRVRTRLGHEIVASANHPFRTVEGWKRLEDLGVGDHVAVARTMDVFGVDRRSNAEVALVAYLIGDGNLTNATPRLTAKDSSIVADAARWIDQMGLELSRIGSTISYSIRVPSGPTLEQVAEAAGFSIGTVSLVVAGDSRPAQATREAVWAQIDRLGYVPQRARKSNTLTDVLQESGLMGLTSHEKFIPEWVFRLPEDQVALFLNRLFATDGSAWVSAGSYRIEYVTVSRRLAEDVQHLLRRFGVIAKLRSRSVSYGGERRIAYEVGFQDPLSVEVFAAQIGIFSKESAVEQVRALAMSRRVQRFADLVPSAVVDVLDHHRQRDGWSWSELERHLGSRIKRGQRISRDRLLRIAKILNSTELLNLATSDVVWDEVVSIESDGSAETYDLQVPVHENFVANDFVVHNSALATNIAANIALHGGTVAMFSLEMGAEEVVQRFLCSIGRVDSMKLRSGQLSPEQWQKVVHAASRLYEANIYVDDSSNVMMTDIRAKSRRLKRSRGLDLIVVDYLQLMQGRNRENRQQEIAEISRNLKNLARELHIPIIAISQLNRALEQREDKRPRLGDLRESGAIEQDSDVVMFIYRDEYYNPETSEYRGMAEVNIAKHRAGATGRVQMTFLPEFTLFADLGRDVAP